MFSLRSTVIIFVAVLVLSAVVYVTLAQNNSTKVLSIPPESAQNNMMVQAENITPKIETSEIHSADGKMNLIMDKKTENGSATYTFIVADIPETFRKQVFEKSLSSPGFMTISINAWSPDNKYFFIHEEGTGHPNYLVFKESGESFADGSQFIDIGSVFLSKETGFDLVDVTGWDSPTLLHIFSNTQDGERGPSYWFEVPSTALIRLSGR